MNLEKFIIKHYGILFCLIQIFQLIVFFICFWKHEVYQIGFLAICMIIQFSTFKWVNER